MPRIPGIRRLFRFPSSEAHVNHDVAEEITFHLEERTQQLRAQGLDLETARAAALREFGDVREARAELAEIGRRRVRYQRRASWWSDLRHDLKYGARSLWHAPLFTLLAIVTLALGLGANAAVFGVVKSVLLDALPYAEPDRLVNVHARWLDGSMTRGPLSAGTVVDLAARQQSFARVSAFFANVSDAIYGEESGSRIARLAWVEPNFFDTLGVTAARGRLLTPGDATSGLAPLSAATLVPDTAGSVLVTHGAWQRLFGADPAVPGRTIRLNGVTRTIVGVLPRGFIGPLGDVDFYAAFDLAPVAARPTMARTAYWLGAIGRLKPERTHESAQHEVAAIGTALTSEHPANRGIALAALPLRDVMIGNTRTPLLILMTSAALVLLIACANLTGALVARTLSRRTEFAVRIALGAGRGRLIRQLLAESLLLATAGGAAGVLLAWLVLSALKSVARTALPDYADLTLDGGVVFVTAALSLCVGLAFGFAPAMSVDRSDPQGALRAGTRGASESRRAHRLRGLLVGGQIALCLSLLASAGLLARSLWTMTTAPLGFDADHVLTATVQMPPRDYPTPAARIRFLEQFADRLRTLPGVQSVADASLIPAGFGSRTSFTIDGAPPQRPDEGQPGAFRTMVSDDYFRTLRIPLRQGRTFDARDRRSAPPTVVVSESMARRYWPQGDALGARIRLDAGAPPTEVVGIVGDVRIDRTRPDAEPMLYRSSRQSPWPFAAFVLRTDGDPLALLKPVERELAAIDRGLALERAMSLRTAVGQGLARRQLPVLLMTSFGALALLLASVGVYAMFASIAAARAWEFGLRMALGSHPRAIAGLVLRQGAGWMALGLTVGAAGVVLMVRLLRALLDEVPPLDPIALGVAAAILICCATIAVLIPLHRATHVDPATALRSQ